MTVDPPGVTPVVRAAIVDDIAAVLEFWSRAAQDHNRPADRRDAIEAPITRDPNALLLAVHKERIIGSVIVGWDGWRAHLYRLAVDPAHRRQGVARRLLDSAERRLRDAGAIRIDAMVLNRNDQAHRFWSAAGYNRQENWSRWIKPLR